MKRDDDYIRELLLEAENDDGCLVHAVYTKDEDHEEQRRWCHVMLLCDHGYMAPESETGFRMTAEGHSYLDAIRDETIWKRTKEAVAEGGGSATLEILKTLAIGFLKTKIKEHTGVEV